MQDVLPPSPIPPYSGESVLRAVVDGRMTQTLRMIRDLKVAVVTDGPSGRLYVDIPAGPVGADLPSTYRQFVELVGGRVWTYYKVALWLPDKVQHVSGANYAEVMLMVRSYAAGLNRPPARRPVLTTA